jgi:hypothetical protein
MLKNLDNNIIIFGLYIIMIILGMIIGILYKPKNIIVINNHKEDWLDDLSSSKNKKLISENNLEQINKINIDSSVLVSNIEIDHLTKKFDNFSKTIDSNTTIDNSVDKLKKLKRG